MPVRIIGMIGVTPPSGDASLHVVPAADSTTPPSVSWTRPASPLPVTGMGLPDPYGKHGSVLPVTKPTSRPGQILVVNSGATIT